MKVHSMQPMVHVQDDSLCTALAMHDYVFVVFLVVLLSLPCAQQENQGGEVSVVA